MNVQKIRAAVKYLEEEPRRLDMSIFLSRPYSTLLSNPPCGTVSCLAGTGILLEAKLKQQYFHDLVTEEGGYQQTAAKIFEISEEASARLFHVDNWPQEFVAPYKWLHYDAIYGNIPHPHIQNYIAKAKIQILKARVEHFIGTNGEE